MFYIIFCYIIDFNGIINVFIIDAKLRLNDLFAIIFIVIRKPI